MGIITGGYDGTVDEVQFAGLLPRYSVVGPDDFKATTQAGDRIVSIANGTALGPGVIDVATNLPAIQFAAASGTRWDLVALRRNWQPPGGTSQIVIIQGGASKGYPDVGTAGTAWNRRPGIMDDQPLYLQEVNSTLLGARVDVRCWAAHGGVVAGSEDAKTYLQQVGAEFLADGVIHRYLRGDNGVPGWVGTDNTQAAADVVTYGPGWTGVAGGHKPRLVRSGGMVHLIGAVKQGTTANVSHILTVPANFQPKNPSSTFVGAGVTSEGVSYQLVLGAGKLAIDPDYITGSFPVGSIVPVTASWPMS